MFFLSPRRLADRVSPFRHMLRNEGSFSSPQQTEWATTPNIMLFCLRFHLCAQPGSKQCTLPAVPSDKAHTSSCHPLGHSPCNSESNSVEILTTGAYVRYHDSERHHILCLLSQLLF